MSDALAVLPLSDVDPGRPDLFGGKACGLARLIREGATVPPGFAVQVTARAPASWSDGERSDFHARASALLAHGPIAVRSSAAAEDGVIASYAGLFESVLSVRTPEEALEAVARCIASGAGERVLAYAHAAAPMAVGVVCQTMVDAASAGVCFTVDPTGRDAGVVIEAVAGLGDALVSGHATPDRWRVYRDGRGRWEARADGELRAPFDAAAAVELAQAARALAAHFGCPLDLEWARDAAGRLFWLQARPVTVAAPPPSLAADVSLPRADDGPIRVWGNFNVRETMPEPMPPLSWSMWRDVIPPAITRIAFDASAGDELVNELRLFDRVNGRVYWNLNALIAFPIFGVGVARAMDLVDPRSGRVTNQLLSAGVLTPRRHRRASARRVLDMALRQIPLMRSIWMAFRPHAVMRELQQLGEQERANRAIPLEPMSDAAILREVERIGDGGVMALRSFLHVFGVGIGWWVLAVRLFRRFPDALKAMGSGISLTPTAAMSMELDELVQQARPLVERFALLDAREVLAGLESDEAGRAWLASYRGFLHRNSQRCPREFDLAVPRWDEQPEMLVGLVRASLRNPPSGSLAERMGKLRAERRARVEDAIARSFALVRPLMRRVAATVDAYLPLREAPKHTMLITFQRMRHAALEAGRRLVERGAVDARDDVFFLEVAEVRELLAGRALAHPARQLVTERRRQDRAWATVAPPDFVRSDGVPVVDALPGVVEGALASGVPASMGVATGRVRVLDHPDAEAFQDGDVLVVELADPGWTPLFSRASAIVMEVGGIMCHAAVVARELGIPAVMGVRDARARLKDGQRVTVDGERGVILEAPPES